MDKLNKIFTWIMWALVVIGVGILVWGTVKGYPSSPATDNGTVDPLLNWAYILLGIAVFCWVVFGVIIAIINDPKSLVKLGLGVIAAVAIVGVAYAVAPGAPALGLSVDQPSDSVLKLTDTMLYLTGIIGAGAILSIIAGEIISAIRNK